MTIGLLFEVSGFVSIIFGGSYIQLKMGNINLGFK